MRRSRRALLVCAMLALGGLVSAGGARAESATESPALHPGALELGLAGSLTASEGVSRATLDVRSGWFFGAGPVLMGLEPGVGYSHLRALDTVDLDLGLSAQRRLGSAPLYAHVAVGGGLRQEWLGSFSQARYPVGVSAGFRALFDPRAAVRIEYRFRRVLHDPVADFSEHEIVAGLSLFFRNAR